MGSTIWLGHNHNLMIIHGVAKIGSLNGKIKESPKTNTSYQKKATKNFLVMSWLIQSIQLRIASD